MENAKFPRIPHLPWSPGRGNAADDKVLTSLDGWAGDQIVITEKLDGANICLTRDTVYARSHSGTPTHPMFDWLKAFHAKIRDKLAPGQSYFCEYTYAVHSIRYKSLPSYLWLLRVRDDAHGNWCSWLSTLWYATQLGIPVAPVHGIQPFNSAAPFLSYATNETALRVGIDGTRTQEGLVIWPFSPFADQDFTVKVAKWVRKDHVQTDEHWLNQPIVKQEIL